jgi:peptide/nickel transport system permease protein
MAIESGALIAGAVSRTPAWWRGPLRFARQQPVGMVSLLVLIAIFSASLASPLLAPYDPFANDLSNKWAPPTGVHPMGTDQYGRDTYSRLLLGARYSLLISFGATFLGVTAGALLGLVTAYVRGWVDLLVLRVVDVKMAMPGLVFTLLIVTALGPTMAGVIIALSTALLARAIRVIRATALTTREATYVEAATALGCPPWRVMLVHILPSCIAPYVVLISIAIGGAIVAEASLGYLGLGVQPPTPTWGQILNRAQQTVRQNAWIAIFPGVAISLTVFAFNLLGDAVRDYLDPRLRGR